MTDAHRAANALFGLRDPAFGAEGVRFAFERPLPGWAWPLLALAVVAAAALAYRRLAAPARARAALAALRALALLLIALLLMGPQLERQPERVEPDWVIALVDRSLSLTIRDAPAPPPTPETANPETANPAAAPPADPNAPAVTRDAQLAAALAATADLWSTAAESREVRWLGFDSTALPLAQAEGAALPTLPPPAGRRTDISAALAEAVALAGGKPIAGVVVFSDGRWSAPLDRAVLRRLEAERVPAFVVPLGSATPVADLALRRVQAPGIAFAKDVVPVTVEIDLAAANPANPAEAAPPSGLLVEITDAATGVTRAERRLSGDDLAQLLRQSRPARVTLLVPPGESGRSRWNVRLTPDAPDLIAENNAADLAIELVDRPLRVALFDGSPRWEFRYLRALLLREPSIEAASLLLAPDRRYQQEGAITLDTLPETPEDWASFDVVILGDLRPQLIGEQALANLRAHVADRAAGVVWIAGPASTPAAWRGSALEALLPITLSPTDAGVEPWPVDVTLSRAPAAVRLGLIDLDPADPAAAGDRGGDPVVGNADLGWTRLRWAQRLRPDRLKPAVEVLATARPVDDPAAEASADEGLPLVTSMRFGAGRAVYVGTDETWRWRYGRGDELADRFWLPLIRAAARGRAGRGDRAGTLTATPDPASAGQPVNLVLEVDDQALLESAPAEARVQIEPPGGRPESVTLRREAPATPSGQDPPASSGVARFTAVWRPTEPGRVTVATTGDWPPGEPITAELVVVASDDELLRPQADHEALAALAAATGGAVIAPNEVRSLFEQLPNRENRTPGPLERATLWDRWVVWATLIGLLGLEWLGRRLVRLA